MLPHRRRMRRDGHKFGHSRRCAVMRRTGNCGPLRKVISRTTERYELPSGYVAYLECEVLECGHVIRIKQDIYGETNAYRRRCKQCADALSGRCA